MPKVQLQKENFFAFTRRFTTIQKDSVRFAKNFEDSPPATDEKLLQLEKSLSQAQQCVKYLDIVTIDNCTTQNKDMLDRLHYGRIKKRQAKGEFLCADNYTIFETDRNIHVSKDDS